MSSNESKELWDELKAGLNFDMPADYPEGLPLYWRREATGFLVESVQAYLRNEPLTASQFRLLKAYVSHWINAPCWRWPEEYGETSRIELMATLNWVKNRAGLAAVLEDLSNAGIDPL